MNRDPHRRGSGGQRIVAPAYRHTTSRAARWRALSAVLLVFVSACGSPNPAPAGASPSPTKGAQSIAPSPGSTSDLAIRIDSLVGDLAQKGVFSGSVLVAKDDSIVISKGYGLADRETDTANTPKTRFRLASITKSFTAIAILQLQQQGKLHVEDLICAYLPDCPASWKSIAIHHVLTHTSGLRDIETGAATPSEVVARAQNLPLLAEAGAEFHYSNTGYVVLTAVVERMSGVSYGAFLQSQVLDPLGMQDTGVYSGESGLAVAYSSGTKIQQPDMTATAGAASLYSTTEDLYRWDQGLETQALLSRALQNEMYVPYAAMDLPHPADMGSFSYGYGWVVYSVLGHQVIGNGGIATGVRAEFDRFPDDGLTVIFLSNDDQFDADALLIDLSRIVLGAN